MADKTEEIEDCFILDFNPDEFLDLWWHAETIHMHDMSAKYPFKKVLHQSCRKLGYARYDKQNHRSLFRIKPTKSVFVFSSTDDRNEELTTRGFRDLETRSSSSKLIVIILENKFFD
ncbi:hypothetical protein LguiB_027087 [Lonicera macranthoides]